MPVTRSFKWSGRPESDSGTRQDSSADNLPKDYGNDSGIELVKPKRVFISGVLLTKKIGFLFDKVKTRVEAYFKF